MAMEIIIAEVHDYELHKQIDLAATDSAADSGHGSLDNFPGLDLSDCEFNEEFSTQENSAASSRRGSADVIPLAPPPPPLPGSVSLDLQLLPVRSYSPVRGEAWYIEYNDSDSDMDDHLSDLGYDFMSRHKTKRPAPAIQKEVQKEVLECIVCYQEVSDLPSSKRKCCSSYVCKDCMRAMAITNLDEAIIFISCPNPECQSNLSKDEIESLLPDKSSKEKFERMRLEAEGYGKKKACPKCNHLTEHNLPKKLFFKQYKEEEVHINCSQCGFDWCYNCHTPWHKDLTCKEFKKGNERFKSWTQGRSKTGIANCQKCPFCRVYIQRSTGCDHMTCNRCDTHFCYKCGGRFLSFPGFGDHYTQTGILGCEQNYCKKKPMKRRAVRGAYFGAKVSFLAGYPVLFLGGIAVIAVVGAVALPIYAGYRYHKYRKNVKRRYGRRKRV